MNTLLLDAPSWDLTTDAGKNIAVAEEPLALAQDAASAIRLFSGELWYDTTRGVPYWLRVLGRTPPLALVRSKLVSAAKTVPGVITARCFFSSFGHRTLSGQVQVTDRTGALAAARF